MAESKDTASPKAAREHARAQAAQADAVTAKPTVPARNARDLPDGVAPQAMVWAETLAVGGYAARILERGTRLRIVDTDGGACVGLLAYNADAPWERLNVADTVKVQWQAYLGEGSLLLSDMGRVLLTMVRDTSGKHDALCGASSPWSHAARYGDGSNHGAFPSARDRFALALAKFGMSKRDITANVNLFRRVVVTPEGRLEFDTSGSPAGAFVELRAEMRALVVVVNSPHVLDPQPKPSPSSVRLLAWRGIPAGADCPFRASTPERQRAFENVDDLYAQAAPGGVV